MGRLARKQQVMSIMRIIVSTLCIVLICAAAAEESSDDGYSTEFVVPETSLSDKSAFMPKSWVQQQLHKQTNQLLSTTTTKGRAKEIQEGKEESHKGKSQTFKS